MKSLIVFFAAFLLVFTGTGAHKAFAASKTETQVSVAQKAVNLTVRETVKASDECCDKEREKTSKAHASCSMPVATLSESNIFSCALKAEALVVPAPHLARGKLPSKLKRPPRNSLI